MSPFNNVITQTDANIYIFFQVPEVTPTPAVVDEDGHVSEESEVDLPVIPGLERHKTKLTIAEFYAPTPEVPRQQAGLFLCYNFDVDCH